MIAPNSLLAWRALMDRINKSSAGKFVGGATDMLLPEKASDLLTGPAYAVRHPLDSAQLLLRGMQDASQNQFEKMYAAPTTSEAIGHGLAGAIPMIGPAAGMAGEEIGAGNTARGLGMASALLAPSLYHGIKPIVSEATGLMEAVKRAKNINAIREANKAARYDALVNSSRNANANYVKAAPDVSPIPGIEDTSVPNETLWRGGGESNVPGGTYYSTDPKVAKRYAKLHGDKKNVNSYSPNPYDQSLRGSSAKIDVESEAGLSAVDEILRRSGQESTGGINSDMEATLPYLRNKGYRQVQIPYMPSPEDSLAGPERVMLKPTGSLSQLRDDPNVRVPGLTDPYATSLPEPAAIDPLTGLPTRRDALKAGGAAALATAIGARAMEGMGKVPEVAAAIDAPVLGRAAPSALGREGFYRETKHRAVGYSDPNVVTKLGETPVRDLPYDPNTGKLFGLGESHGSRLDPSIAPNRALDDLNPQGKVEDGVGDRFFLTRTEGVDEAGNPVYGKQVYRLNRGANLREALRSFGEGVKQYELTPFGEIPTSYEGSGGMPTVNRIVHSEITPEAALRLNTIEKRQATNMVIGPKGGLSKKVQSIHDITNPDKYTFYKVQDQDGAILKVVASEAATGKGIPADLHNRGLRVLAATAQDMVKRDLLDPRDLGMSAKYHLWETVGGHLEEIPFEEAKAISNNKHGSDYGGLVLEDAFPRQGISPRYTKRVSIRLLKDTMAKQIAENKRAAGLKPPPLLSKPEPLPQILQDNPLLNPTIKPRENPFFSNPIHITRMKFLRGKKS